MSDPYEPFDMARLMQAVNAAPSILNTRPWQLDRVAAHRFELRPDWDRHLRIIDPLHRELLISCGAALFNLRLAIRVTGHDPVVWLLPDEQTGGPVCPHCGDSCGVGDLLASVEIVTRPAHPVTATEQRLYEEIPRRQTVREPFLSKMPMSVQAELEQAARMEGAQARLLHRRDTRRLLRHAAQADQKLKLDPPYMAELRKWTGGNATPAHGVPGRQIRARASLSAPSSAPGSEPGLAGHAPAEEEVRVAPVDCAGDGVRQAIRLAAGRPGPAAASADRVVLPPAGLLPDPRTRRGRHGNAFGPVGQAAVAVARVGADGHKDRREIGVRGAPRFRPRRPHLRFRARSVAAEARSGRGCATYRA